MAFLIFLLFFQQTMPNAYIPTNNDREMYAFKKLHREKSFDEARTAVQSQIERIFQKAAAAKHQDKQVKRPGEVEVVSPLSAAHHGITLKVKSQFKSQWEKADFLHC